MIYAKDREQLNSQKWSCITIFSKMYPVIMIRSYNDAYVQIIRCGDVHFINKIKALKNSVGFLVLCFYC